MLDNEIVDSAFAFEFAKIAGFRNFLSHGYEKRDAKIVCRNVLSKIEEVKGIWRRLKMSSVFELLTLNFKKRAIIKWPHMAHAPHGD